MRLPGSQQSNLWGSLTLANRPRFVSSQVLEPTSRTVPDKIKAAGGAALERMAAAGVNFSETVVVGHNYETEWEVECGDFENDTTVLTAFAECVVAYAYCYYDGQMVGIPYSYTGVPGFTDFCAAADLYFGDDGILPRCVRSS